MEIINVAPSVLKVHPRNQEFFDDIQGDEYERFEKSIAEDGILSALLVAPDMTVISGHQRLKAAIHLNMSKVPIVIKNDVESEDDKTRLLLSANFGRYKNDPVKQGKIIDEYAKLCGIRKGGDRRGSKGNNSLLKTLEDIAKENGVDVTTIKNLRSLANLDPDLQELISTGRVTPTTGYKVIAKLSAEEQAKLFESLPKDVKLSQKEVQEYVDELQKDLDFANDDLNDAVERLGEASKEISKKNAELKLAQEEAGILRRKLEDKERDIAGEIMAERDNYKLSATESANKYFKFKAEAEDAKGRLEVMEKKLAQYASGELSGGVPKAVNDEVANLYKKIALLEKEKEEIRKNVEAHISHDIDELLRFAENAAKVFTAYTTSEATFSVMGALPDVRSRLAACVKTIIDSAEMIMNAASGDVFAQFSDDGTSYSAPNLH